LSALATVVEHFDVAGFLLTGAVGRTCTAAALVCRFGHGGMKRAQAAAELAPASALALGLGACGGGPTVAEAIE
jgi:hypothetical protein